MQNFKSPAQLKVKIEKFEVSQSPILTSYLSLDPNGKIQHSIREFSMGKFELQEPTSQLLNALKSHTFAFELFSDRNN